MSAVAPPTVVTFGEILLRLMARDGVRLEDAGEFLATYGGGEANVAVSLAQAGVAARLITRVPANELGEAAVRRLRGLGVDVAGVVRGGERLGTYFLEPGAAQRPAKVVYDREASGFASLEPASFDWPKVLADASWFHTTGISPAVGQAPAEAAIEGAACAAALGLDVSVDLNYRAKLWSWTTDMAGVMERLTTSATVIVGNEEDASKVFGIRPTGTDVTSGRVDAGAYRRVCEELFERFPRVRLIAFTLRGSRSASHNTWSGLLCERDGGFHVGPSYEVLPIIDRVGTGDAFAAGLIRALLANPEDAAGALAWAVGASCLKHTILGDLNLVTTAEVRRLVEGDGSGRVLR